MSDISTVLKYKIGDNVIYKNSGICCVCDVKEMSFTTPEKKLYYVLSPVYSKGSHTYVPAELEDSMRDIICKEEAEKAISSFSSIELEWIPEIKARAEYLNSVIANFNRAEILAVVKMLSEHKKECESKRKKMYASDSKILNIAEKMIRDEFAFVLGIEREEVFDYIKNAISK